jgi:hypothetical protein
LPECCGLPGGAVDQIGSDCAYALITGDAHGGLLFSVKWFQSHAKLA